jgi:hypothetical protein
VVKQIPQGGVAAEREHHSGERHDVPDDPLREPRTPSVIPPGPP